MGKIQNHERTLASDGWHLKNCALIAACLLLLVIPLSQVRCQPAPASKEPPLAGLKLRAKALSSSPNTLLSPEAREWAGAALYRVSLNRTPPLYDTDPPAQNEIPYAEVRLARAGGKVLVQLSWKDATEDTATIMAPPSSPPEQRNRKDQSSATDRFIDAAAIMVPARGVTGDLSPSLQMGDAQLPVKIYYWNAARGPMLMEAQGRSTTRRTGEGFPAKGLYRAGTWKVVFELPELQTGTPLAFAIWNGSQKDRDGRKYFSVWHWVE